MAKNLKFPKIPANLCPERSTMGPTLYNLLLELSIIREKKTISRAILANICLRNSRADIGFDTAKFRGLHTRRSTNSTTVVKSGRGELVRGSDPPLVYGARFTAFLWRAPIRLLLKTRLTAGV